MECLLNLYFTGCQTQVMIVLGFYLYLYMINILLISAVKTFNFAIMKQIFLITLNTLTYFVGIKTVVQFEY